MVRRVLGVDLPSVPPDPVPVAPRRPALPGAPPPQPSASPTRVEPERSLSPPPQGSVQVRAGGLRLNVPVVVVTGLLSAAAGAFGGQRAGTAAEVAETREAILREVRQALQDDRETRRQDLRDALAPVNARIDGLETRERHNIPLLAAVANRLGSNLRYQDGTRPEVEFHPQPLSPRAAPVQPKDTLVLP